MTATCTETHGVQASLHARFAVLTMPGLPGRALLEKILRLEGLQVITVGDAALAVEVARLTQPELVLIDLLLPSPDGAHTLGQLHACGLSGRTVVLSASGSARAARLAMSFGIGGFLAKPFSLDALLGAVRGAGTEGSRVAKEAECGP